MPTWQYHARVKQAPFRTEGVPLSRPAQAWAPPRMASHTTMQCAVRPARLVLCTAKCRLTRGRCVHSAFYARRACRCGSGRTCREASALHASGQLRPVRAARHHVLHVKGLNTLGLGFVELGEGQCRVAGVLRVEDLDTVNLGSAKLGVNQCRVAAGLGNVAASGPHH